MSVRGTRYMLGREAALFRDMTRVICDVLEGRGYIPFIPSSLAESEVFVEKAGAEVLGQMYAFRDKGDRDICLIPEVTAVCQRLFKEDWGKSMKKPVRVYYATRCYRYERPQKGRYREFWQVGAENMGGDTSTVEMTDLLAECLDAAGAVGMYQINGNVKRGLDYYVEDGFEAEVASLGAQKQVAGGGRYDCGIGWGIGLDRLQMAVDGPDVVGKRS